MIWRCLLVSMLLSSSIALAADRPRDPGQFFFNDSFWDFTEELENARESGKKGILLTFEMDECPFCQRMKATVLNQPEVQDYFREHFLIFPVDIEGDVEVGDFKGRTTTMKVFTGAARDKDEFMLLGKYVVDKAYAKQSFTRYKRSNSAPWFPGSSARSMCDPGSRSARAMSW